MPVHDFLPGREAELLTWSANFAARIGADPGAVGLSVPQAAQYAVLHDALATAYLVATSQSTNSSSAVIFKTEVKRQLIAEARALAGIVQRFPATTNAQRVELGLSVRAARSSPIGPPTSAPGLAVVAAVGVTLHVRLVNEAEPSRRGRPHGVAGAAIFSFVGPNPPQTRAGWTFHGHATRMTHAIHFPTATPPGAKVWLTACWINPRLQSGPFCTPVGVNLPGGAAMAA